MDQVTAGIAITLGPKEQMEEHDSSVWKVKALVRIVDTNGAVEDSLDREWFVVASRPTGAIPMLLEKFSKGYGWRLSGSAIIAGIEILSIEWVAPVDILPK